MARQTPSEVANRCRGMKGVVVPDLNHCQKTVERMNAAGRPLAEIEDYIERCALDEIEKAALWMLAWASQDQATQLRLAKETLALAASLRTSPRSDRQMRRQRQPRRIGQPPHLAPADRAARRRDSHAARAGAR